ncbi:methionyl-tRNA formyltransferase [Haloferax profundi]|uniref:Formyl transferase n=1 Tax=Haloferax profundi TaxID=1544718 RepID=A0A0W1SWR6_9EURY|nr:formyltransferase family protein [Haloferax profundi]KTG30933.1 formyl transferase [Haloferax profundi]
MDIVFLGVNDVGFRIYEWLCERDGVDVLALVTEKDQLGLIHDLTPDLLVSVGYNYLVPESVLDVPTRGAINLHPSYLPYNAGKSPNVWSLVEGTPAGATLHYMNDSFDEGEIIERKRVDTSFEDTGKDVHRRLEAAQFEMFREVWPAIEDGEVETKKQDLEQGTYHTTQDFVNLCKIDTDETVRVEDFLNQLRALTFPPFDNAFVEIDGKRYYIDIEIRRADDGDCADSPSDGLIESY